MGYVSIHGLGATIRAAVSDTEDLQIRGLQGHAPLGVDEGMWFPYDYPKLARFWMGRVEFPIDMVFARAQGDGTFVVAKVARNVQPGDLEPISASKIDGVLELAAHRADVVSLGDVFRVASGWVGEARRRRATTAPDTEPEVTLSDEIADGRSQTTPGKGDPRKLILGKKADSAIEDGFLVAFETSETWGRLREAIADAATRRAETAPEADPVDRVRTLYEIRFSSSSPSLEKEDDDHVDDVVSQGSPEFRERLGRIARNHVDGIKFKLTFTEAAGVARDGSMLPERSWTETFTAHYEGVTKVDSNGVVLSIRLT